MPILQKLIDVILERMVNVKNWMKVWGLVFICLSPIFIEEICKQYPKIDYCRFVGFYLRDQEPVSTSTSSSTTTFSFSTPYGVSSLGTTTTTMPLGTILGSTTTTTQYTI